MSKRIEALRAQVDEAEKDLEAAQKEHRANLAAVREAEKKARESCAKASELVNYVAPLRAALKKLQPEAA